MVVFVQLVMFGEVPFLLAFSLIYLDPEFLLQPLNLPVHPLLALYVYVDHRLQALNLMVFNKALVL